MDYNFQKEKRQEPAVVRRLDMKNAANSNYLKKSNLLAQKLNHFSDASLQNELSTNS